MKNNNKYRKRTLETAKTNYTHHFSFNLMKNVWRWIFTVIEYLTSYQLFTFAATEIDVYFISMLIMKFAINWPPYICTTNLVRSMTFQKLLPFLISNRILTQEKIHCALLSRKHLRLIIFLAAPHSSPFAYVGARMYTTHFHFMLTKVKQKMKKNE